MTPDEIAADRAVIDAATDGPWTLMGGMKPGVQRITNGAALVIAETFWSGEGDGPDAAFIAAARTDWPRALDALEAAQEGNDSLGAMVEWLAEVIVDARQACIDAESIEPSGSPEWVESGIAMRKTVLYEVRKVLNRERTAHPSALDRVEAERDEARAEVERLWIEVRNASDTLIRQGQIMHGLAKQVARVRALCDEAGAQVFMGSAADRWLDYEAVEDALDGEAT